jgi:GNAT superfamily N-acetyltransferase
MSSGTDLTLALATPEDAELLTIIQAITFYDDRKWMPPEYIDPALPVEGPDGCRSVEWNRRVIGNPRVRYYKALVGQRMIGGLILFDVGDGAWDLSRIFVDPDFQDGGRGQAIVRAMYVLHPDVDRWRLGTPEWATRNRHFYEKMGFSQVSVIPAGEGVPWRSIAYENGLSQEERAQL